MSKQNSASLSSPAQFSLKVTAGHPEEFDMWQAAVAPMFEIAPLTKQARASFKMKTHGYFLPGLAITTTTSSGCTFIRSRDVIASSGIDNILVQIYLKGSYRLDAEGLRTKISSGDIVIFDLTRECTIEASNYTNLALTLQREFLAPLVVDLEKLHGLILKAGAPRNVLLRSHMEAMHSQVSRMGSSDQAAAAQGTAALVASCVSPSLKSVTRSAPQKAPVTLQLIRSAIDQRLGDKNLSPESLAEHFGMSRASIYRLFEPLGGVRAYIQQRRLMQAYQLMTNPSHFDEPIGAIAKQLGFHETTAFSRAFRSLYKMTPSDVRVAARSGNFSAHPGAASAESSFDMLNRWLLGLDANSEPRRSK